MKSYKKEFGRAASALTVLWGIAVWCGVMDCRANDTAEVETKPNIVFIMADDLGYGDLGCYGQKLIRTPNIDRLAKEGIRFTQAYAGGSVCTPTRASLMTGKHNGHSPARDNIPHYATYLEEEDVTIAEVLSDTGYRCGGVGKWSLGDAGSVGRATNQGFATWLGYLNQDDAHYYFPEFLDENEGRLELPGNQKSREHYSHHLMFERALEFIRESKDGPFFLYGAFTLPHFSSGSEDPTRLTIPSDAPYSAEDWPQAAKNYAAMVTMLDRDVGKMVQLIDDLGLKERTLIVFTSDNGAWGELPETFRSSGPLRGAKRDLYEGGIRVPFIARQPGIIPVDQKSDEVITLWDMLPTLAELAGGKVPEGIDGHSVTEALRGESVKEPHEYLYWDYGHCRERYDQAVRLGSWKGIRLGQGSAIQLYDLTSDPSETTDVAKKHPEVVKEIEKRMEMAVTPSEKYPVGWVYPGRGKK